MARTKVNPAPRWSGWCLDRYCSGCRVAGCEHDCHLTATSKPDPSRVRRVKRPKPKRH